MRSDTFPLPQAPALLDSEPAISAEKSHPSIGGFRRLPAKSIPNQRAQSQSLRGYYFLAISQKVAELFQIGPQEVLMPRANNPIG